MIKQQQQLLQLLLLQLVIFNSCLSAWKKELDFACKVSGDRSWPMTNLPASAFHSSSAYHDFTADQAVIRAGDESSKAWCPKAKLQPNATNEWLQVDFLSLTIIQSINTSPRIHGESENGELTKWYKVQYRRRDDEEFRNYSRLVGDREPFRKTQLIKGNTNIKERSSYAFLKPAIVAKSIRIVPVNRDPQNVVVCLRVAVTGCKTYHGAVNYSAPIGHQQFKDKVYDGWVSGDRLVGGLGLLTDFVTTNLRPDQQSDGGTAASSAFVGWNRRILGRDFIDLQFNFDRVRLFDCVRIDVSNAFTSLNARIFSRIRVSFSFDGHKFGKAVDKRPHPDNHNMATRTVTILHGQRMAIAVQLRVFFADNSDWLMISEISFNSSVVSESSLLQHQLNAIKSNQIHQQQQQQQQQHIMPTLQSSQQPQQSGINNVDSVQGGGGGGERRDSIEHVQIGQTGSELAYITIIAASLVVASMLLLAVGLLCIRRRQLREKQRKGASGHGKQTDSVHLDFTNGRPAVLLNGKSLGVYSSLPESDDDDDDEEEEEDFMTRAAETAGYGIRAQCQMPGREYASTTLCNSVSAVRGVDPPAYHIMGNIGNVGNITTNPLADINFGIHRKQQQQQQQQQLSKQQRRQQQQQQQQPIYHTAIMQYYSPMQQQQQQHLQQLQLNLSPPPIPPFPSDLCIQGCSGNTVYASPSSLLGAGADDLAELEVPLSNLQLQDRLGGGQFGEVRVAQWLNPSGHMQQVAVKTLRSDARQQAREDFRREMRLLARLHDPNIVRVLGVVTKDPQCILVEFMQHGDLHQLLNRRQLQQQIQMQQQQQWLGCLLHMAAQVSSGMKFLESQQLVHRDLACRNCLVGAGLQVKISDFGMSRQLYSGHYCRLRGRAVLPIRWMAWESVLHGRFTTSSDVWSFAVTLWEMLTFCRQQPFAQLSDEEVVANCQHILVCNGAARPLQCPSICPQEIFDLMCECWQRDEACRPTFREIHMFLLRKNMGYSPDKDPLVQLLLSR